MPGFVPGAEWIHKTDEFCYLVKINQQGLREENLPYAKPKDEFRVLVLGPSWAFGWGVPEHDSVPEQLEAELQKHYHSKKIKVINAGQPGQWLYRNILYYINEGYKYQPDLVVLFQWQGIGPQMLYDWNTVFNANTAVFNVDMWFARLYRDLVRVPVLGRSQLVFYVLERLRRVSAVRAYIAGHIHNTFASTQFNIPRNPENERQFRGVYEKSGLAAKYIAQAARENFAVTRDLVYDNLSSETNRELTKIAAGLIAEFQGALRAQGTDFLFYSFCGHPYLSQKDAVLQDLQTATFTRDYSRKNGINFVSSNELFFERMGLRYGDPAHWKYLYRNDRHPTPAGYRLLAGHLSETLIKRGYYQRWLDKTAASR